jgi:hypothetical protein
MRWISSAAINSAEPGEPYQRSAISGVMAGLAWRRLWFAAACGP